MPEAAPLAPFGHSEQNGVCFRELIPSPSLSNFRLNASSRQLATTATTTLVAWSPTYDQRPRDQKPYMVANIRPAGRVVANLRPRPRPLWSRGRQLATTVTTTLVAGRDRTPPRSISTADMENRCNLLVDGLDVGDACFASDPACLALLLRTISLFRSAEAFSCGLPVAAESRFSPHNRECWVACRLPGVQPG